MLFAFAFLVSFWGCGGGSAPQSKQAPASNAFVDPKLEALWQGAQTAVATQPITLNAASVAEGKASPSVIEADTRAYGVSPSGITVTAIPDLTVAELQAQNPDLQLQHTTDPTGIINAPASSGVTYCHSYINGSSIFVAQSLLYNPGATGYEMQNAILERLGYNISRR